MKYDPQVVEGYLNSLGYKVIVPEYQKHISIWMNWYQGKVKEFHDYKMYNGFQFVDKERRSLGMPKRVSEDWASILYNDKVCISIGGKEKDDSGTKQESFDLALENNKFDKKFSELLERTFALGTGACVVFDDGSGKPIIDYIVAPMIFPLRQENGEIVDCAFGSVRGDSYYVNIHIRQSDGSYCVENRAFKINSLQPNGYGDIPLENAKSEYTSPVKMFQIYKPNIANNIDLFAPQGMSVFGNAIDQNKTIDLIYDSFGNEFDLGRKRVFVRSEALTYKTVIGVDRNGKSTTEEVPIFDPEQTEFYALPGEEADPLITEVNSNLRVTEHIDALQTALNLFSDACGLGPDRYVFRDGKVYTNNNQVISTQSKLYKNVLKHEKVLRDSMTELVRAVMYVCTGSVYTDDVTIDFDDSIVEDKEQTRQQAILELNNNLIDDVQYYIDVYKMTEDQAIQFRDRIKKRSPMKEEEEEPPIGA